MNVVAFGGGTNSTAMIIGMHARGIPIDLITFADTGAEHPHTYAFIDTFNAWLAGHGLPTITPVYYTDRDGWRQTLEEDCLRNKCLPSIAYGWKKCSLKYKISPQEKFCNTHPACVATWNAGGKANKFIGYDAGERRRVEHAAIANANVGNKKYENHYPLFEWGWSRETCVDIIRAEGLPIPGKSSCFFCPSMKKKEIERLWTENPALFERALALEDNAKETLRTVIGLGRNWKWSDYYKGFMDAKAFDDSQVKMWDIYEEAAGGCLCGAPCGCYDG